MAFTVNMSGTTQVDNSIVLAYDQAFLVAQAQDDVMDQFVQYRASIGAKSIEFPIYSQLALATTPLTEDVDPDSEAMVDAQIILTPVEYGKVVTRTALANLQSGGRVDVAAATLVGKNLSATSNKLATTALDASGNVVIPGAGTEAGLLIGDIMTRTLVSTMFNKLARSNVAPLGTEYVMIAHDDVIADLRDDTNAGSWTDVSKYSVPGSVLRNEVGMYQGFRVVRNNHATYADQSGAGLIDIYNSYFIGFNALGKAVSKEPGMVATGPFDKLARFVNIGWHGVFQYKIVDPAAVWVCRTASSRGANLA